MAQEWERLDRARAGRVQARGQRARDRDKQVQLAKLISRYEEDRERGTLAFLRAARERSTSQEGWAILTQAKTIADEYRRQAEAAQELAEEGRNAVRNTRRHVNDALKKLLKDHDLSEDDERRALDDVQTVTDDHAHQIDELQKAKDVELLDH